MKKVLISLMFVLLFVVGSCGGDDSSEKSGLNESCTKTADCKDGLKCIDLVCVSDSGNTGDTGDTGNTGDTGDTGNTGNTGDADSDLSDFDAETDEDADETPDDDIIIPFCGNTQVDEGEICDGNTIACESLGFGSTSGTAECSSDCKSWITAGNCTRTLDCSSKPANTVWNTVTNITQTWDGSEWLPSEVGVYGTKSSTTECRFKCDANCYWNGAACVLGAICTGQTKCYDDTVEMTCPSSGTSYYGQDAQYLDKCIPKSYTISGTNPQEIVTDNNTGLQWQRTIPTSEYLWQEAIDYCDGLTYAGQRDWRLPTFSELETLPDYSRYHPAIDPTYFPNTPAASYFWGSDSYVVAKEQGWLVGFDYGSTYYTNKTSPSYTPDYVRCVRGDSLPESSFTESTVSGKVIVTDSVTGLIWAKEYSGSEVTWVNALNYCENLDYAGYTDWRLPNINELKTLVNRTTYNPASSFPGMPSNWFWSSSSNVDHTDYAWLVSFGYGDVGNYDKPNAGHARCLR